MPGAQKNDAVGEDGVVGEEAAIGVDDAPVVRRARDR